MVDPNTIADGYVALWNEPDPGRRRQLIVDLWAEDAIHVLEPPEEIREIAARPGIGLHARLEAKGHAALEERARSAYEEWGGRQQFSFRRRDNVVRIADVIKFNWEMVTTEGEVAAVGLEFLVLGANDRVVRDYQFIER
jgi:hypothetical protein